MHVNTVCLQCMTSVSCSKVLKHVTYAILSGYHTEQDQSKSYWVNDGVGRTSSQNAQLHRMNWCNQQHLSACVWTRLHKNFLSNFRETVELSGSVVRRIDYILGLIQLKMADRPQFLIYVTVYWIGTRNCMVWAVRLCHLVNNTENKLFSLAFARLCPHIAYY